MIEAARHPLLIAHRGESAEAPENTLGAVRLAWDRGDRAVEIDVRLTADGGIVVIHDADLRRTGGVRRSVAKSTWPELAGLDVGRWKHACWAGERVPLLADVLSTVPSGAALFVEVKVGAEIVGALAEVVREHSRVGVSLVFMSFDPGTVKALARGLPGHAICLLCTARQWLGRGGIATTIALARDCGASALDLETHGRLDSRVVAAVHDAGLRLYVWTVNRVATARRLAAAGVDGITTDRCAWMHERLGASRR